MNSFGAKAPFDIDGKTYTIFRLSALEDKGISLSRLPFSLRILLENLLRNEDGRAVTASDIEALAHWDPNAEPSREIAFTPARTLLQDFTGVPCVVDLASMRDAMAEFGGDPQKINPLQPVELVIDHSVQVDAYGSEAAIQINRDLEYNRNEERYKFLKWGQKALDNFKAVPPNTGIVHQVNLEYLARVVMESKDEGRRTKDENAETDSTLDPRPSTLAYPDTLVGTDSHTTMINGLGVLGWGVGGIEAEAAMLGQPVSMLIPQVVGFRLSGKLPEGATATDLVLTVTQMLRAKGVVGKFVEFYGPGIAALPIADRATLANMAPEYGATCGLFPVDDESLRYMRLTGRPEEQVRLAEEYMKAQGLFHTADSPEAEYSDSLSLDLSSVVPSMAGPKRPQDRVELSQVAASFQKTFSDVCPTHASIQSVAMTNGPARMESEGGIAVLESPGNKYDLCHGAVVIAAITSCTNTSNPSVMVAAGLVAKKAWEKGLTPKPWVKTSMAPGSRVVTAYLKESGLLDYLDKQRFNVVGYGCTTCIGNSGPLPQEIAKEVRDKDLAVVSVLSGNRNFEGRVNPDVKANYLASPPLVVAYALAGTIGIDMTKDALGNDSKGQPVYLRDIWPSQKEIADTVASCVQRDMFRKNYAEVYQGDEKWEALDATQSENYAWEANSTYIRQAPYFDGMPILAPERVQELKGMRVLAMLGDSVTTDHISPAGSIKANSPAGKYLMEHGVPPELFNSYGSRRGNHEVMIRGTFANVRLRNQLAPGTEGGFTTYFPGNEVMTIYDAATKYQTDRTPLIVLAGKEYGTGSSRDWAAKGVLLLGVKCVIAESMERIHRSNLIGMGVLPLQYLAGENATSLGLTGRETCDLLDLSAEFEKGFPNDKMLTVRATAEDETVKEFKVKVRIDTPQEMLYYRHGGILQYVLRQLVNS